MTTSPIHRPSARVLLIEPGGALLLFQCRTSRDAIETIWVTPGGGMRPGESPAEGAARELAEETGVQLSPQAMGPAVARASGEWSADGQVYYGRDTYFCIRMPRIEVDTGGQEDLERSLIIGHRWWTADEMAATDERIVPPGLAGLLRSLLADGPPAEPIHLPWN
jgi:8-oxo-dGTP pyrophosphatase MutT (NUDIX family)